MDKTTLNLLAGIAHELRTPLGAIGGYADLLRMGLHGPLTAPQQEGLVRIRRNQEQMIVFLNACMSYAAAAAGDIPVVIEAVPFVPLLQRATTACADRASERGVAIEIAAQAGSEDASIETATVLVDRAAADTMLVELLLDALAGGERGSSVRIGISVHDDMLQVQVASGGVPIAVDAVEKLFVPFSPGEDGSRSATSTQPLSLSHARFLARAMGGDLVAIPGGTSRTVRMKLPYVREPSAVSAH